MTEQAKPTAGEWTHDGICILDGQGRVIALMREPLQFPGDVTRGHPDEEANARLIADAGTTYHRTGMTPSELAGLVVELREQLKSLVRIMPDMTIRDILDRGDEVIEASGLNPWCVNEGLATGDELHDVTWRAQAALTKAQAVTTTT
jgi:hypothetical protein